jgi:hypothetical protein
MKSPRCIASSGRTNRSLRRIVGNPEDTVGGEAPFSREDRSARLSVDPASLDHARAMFIDGQFTGENDEHLDPSMLGIAGRPLVNLRYFPRLTVGQRGKPAVNEHVMSIMKNAKITDA